VQGLTNGLGSEHPDTLKARFDLASTYMERDAGTRRSD